MVFAHALSGFGMSLQVCFTIERRSSTFTRLRIQGRPSQWICRKPEGTRIKEAQYYVRIIWYIHNLLIPNHNLTEFLRTWLLHFPFGRNLLFKNSSVELLLSHLGGDGLLQWARSHPCFPPQTTRW